MKNIIIAMYFFAFAVFALAGGRDASDYLFYSQAQESSPPGPVTIYAMESVGFSDCATITDIFAIGTKPYTISFWIYAKVWGDADYQPFGCFFRNNDGHYPCMWSELPQEITRNVYTDNVRSLEFPVNLPRSNWVHIVITSDSSGMIGYTNGVVAGSSLASTVDNSGGTFRLLNDGYGGNTLDYPRAILGLMCEFAMWTNALTQSEVSALYSATDIPHANLSAAPWNNGYLHCALHLTNTTGSSDADISGNGFNATLVEGMTWGSAAR
jgi:hypothetical protein